MRVLIDPRRLASRSQTWRLVLKVRSLKNLAPALSSMELSLRLRNSRVVLSLRAWEMYLEPS